MSNTPSTDLNNASAAGAVVSLMGFILSFFSQTHIWLQNLVLLVSLTAGLFAISTGVVKVAKWIHKTFFK